MTSFDFMSRPRNIYIRNFELRLLSIISSGFLSAVSFHTFLLVLNRINSPVNEDTSFKIFETLVGTVPHACNPSYSGGRGRLHKFELS